MKRAILILGVILFSMPVFAGTRQVVTTTTSPSGAIPPINCYNDQVQMAKDLNNIEMALYGKTYYGQSLNSRLNRLEQSIFKRTYPTATFQQRIDNLMAQSRYPNRVVQYPTQSNTTSQTIKQGLLDRVRTNLIGVPTGFTPPIGSYGYYGNAYPNNYNPAYYNNPYYNPQFGNSRYYSGNRGWYQNNYGIQSGMGVHILD